MTRPVFFLVALITLGSCSIYDTCSYDDFGCRLPGRWTLETVDGTAASGSMEINTGSYDRDGYLTMATGLETFPEARGPFGGTYLNPLVEGEMRTYRIEISLVEVPCSIGNCSIILETRVEDDAADEDAFTLIVSTYRVPDQTELRVPGLRRAPVFQAGTRLRFTRG
jgi:hypothetical protein